MMRFAERHAQFAHHIIGQISGGWKARGEGGQHGLGLRCHIANHAGGRGNGDAQRIGRIKHPFLVFLHILAISQRQTFQHNQQAIQRADNPARLGADKFGSIRIALLRHDR